MPGAVTGEQRERIVRPDVDGDNFAYKVDKLDAAVPATLDTDVATPADAARYRDDLVMRIGAHFRPPFFRYLPCHVRHINALNVARQAEILRPSSLFYASAMIASLCYCFSVPYGSRTRPSSEML